MTYAAPANNGGDPILFYTATCSDGVDPPVSVMSGSGPTAAPIAVSPLINGNSYTCQVTASNDIGASSPSSSTPSVVVGVPATPAQPSVSQGDLELVVSYVEPVDNGSAITSYSAVCTSMN
ncbi:MAG: hypothetical protein ACLPVY_19500, partial [Acidimicrobiia bacterium]